MGRFTPFDEYGRCRRCPKRAVVGGYCKDHYKTPQRPPGKGTRLTEEEIARLWQLHAAFKTSPEIARELKCATSTVNRYLKLGRPKRG